MSEEDKNQIKAILLELSSDIQIFTERELKKVHYYNGKAYSHKENK